MLTILGANGNQGAYEIDHSYMIDSAAAAGLARFGNNSRNGDTFTISFWVKRTKLGTNQILVCSKAEDSGTNAFVFQFTNADKIKIQGQPQAGTTGAGANRVVILTTAVYRDPAAWYHIVYRHDTTQGTAGNRHRLYVNGVQQATDTNLALDQNTEFLYFYNAGSFPYAIGNDERDNLYGDWYMAEHHYTDGVSNGPDAFGETNDNGVWIPKRYAGSHGTYGHYLKFDNVGGGSGTTAVGEHDYTTGSSSTIGADSSGNDHHFHVQGYGEKNQSEDTPSNNFCTLNILNVTTDVSIREGALKHVNTSNDQGVGGTMGFTKGKWYWEVRCIDKAEVGISLNAETFQLSNDGTVASNNANLLLTALVTNSAGGSNDLRHNGSNESITTVSVADGNIISVAVDADNGKIWFAKNGTYFNSGDPAAGSNEAKDFSGEYTAGNFIIPGFVLATGASDVFEMNFGNPVFDISSANSDANFHGTFEYAVPTGYFALCSKNLAEFG